MNAAPAVLASGGCPLPCATSFHARLKGDVRAGMRKWCRQRFVIHAIMLCLEWSSAVFVPMVAMPRAMSVVVAMKWNLIPMVMRMMGSPSAYLVQAALTAAALAAMGAAWVAALGIHARRLRRRRADVRAEAARGPLVLLTFRRRGIHARPLHRGGADVRAADVRHSKLEVVHGFVAILVMSVPLAEARARVGSAISSPLFRLGGFGCVGGRSMSATVESSTIASAVAMAITHSPSLTIAVARPTGYLIPTKVQLFCSARSLVKYL